MRSFLLSLAGVVALGVLPCSQVACAQDNEGVQAADAPIGIQTGQMFITLENRTGGPLVDLLITIQTSSAPYTNRMWRLESAEKRDVSFGSFSSRDGTTFNLRLARPKLVRVTANDLTQKKYEAQVPWK